MERSDLKLLEHYSLPCIARAPQTRVPGRMLDIPVWVSMGEVARQQGQAMIRGLDLLTPEAGVDRIWTDDGADHVGTAHEAYGDPRIYEWLVSRAPR